MSYEEIRKKLKKVDKNELGLIINIFEQQHYLKAGKNKNQQTILDILEECGVIFKTDEYDSDVVFYVRGNDAFSVYLFRIYLHFWW